MSAGHGGWIGVDLDGTLAEYRGRIDEIGPPIPLMIARVQAWIAAGTWVKIVTARVSSYDMAVREEQRKMIVAWCRRHIGRPLDVTCCKDYAMIELWDDRVVQIEHNTGRRVDGKP